MFVRKLKALLQIMEYGVQCKFICGVYFHPPIECPLIMLH